MISWCECGFFFPRTEGNLIFLAWQCPTFWFPDHIVLMASSHRENFHANEAIVWISPPVAELLDSVLKIARPISVVINFRSDVRSNYYLTQYFIELFIMYDIKIILTNIEHSSAALLYATSTRGSGSTTPSYRPFLKIHKSFTCAMLN